MVAEEVSGECGRSSYKAIQYDADYAFSNFYITDTAEIEKEMKNVPYQYPETILTAIDEKETLEEVFNCGIDFRTQSALFMHAFASRALESPRFTRSTVHFVKSHVDRTAEEQHIPANAKVLSPPNRTDPWPQHSSLQPFRDKTKHKKHCRSHYKTQVTKGNHFDKGQTPQHQTCPDNQTPATYLCSISSWWQNWPYRC